MEAKKIDTEYSNTVIKQRPQLQIVEPNQAERTKNIKLFTLLTFLVPFAGWTYARGIEGLFISLSYIPLAFTLFAPVTGWILFGMFHLTMTYFAYKSLSRTGL